MDQAMDEGAIFGVMSGSRDGSGSNRRSDGWIKLWMREQLTER
jgi:hypothetical protein